MLMITALFARTGTADMRELGGIVRRVPGLSACFFLFGLATIAIPGTVAFAAEDLAVAGDDDQAVGELARQAVAAWRTQEI